MVIRYFILFFAFFSKTVGLSSVFSAEMNSACQNTVITVFWGDLEKKAVFPRIFAPNYGDLEAMGQKIDQYHFGWIWLLSIYKPWFHCFYAILLVTFRENHKKIRNSDNKHFIFLKDRRVELSFQYRNEFCMPKYPTNRIFIGFGE